jgi:hypothetical protein
MLLRDEARTTGASAEASAGEGASAGAGGGASADTGGGASADMQGGTSVVKQPLSLAEAAVAPCIEFAVIEEGGAGGEEEDGEIQMEQEQGDANNDDPGLLTAQPHAVSDEVKKRHFCAIYHIYIMHHFTKTGSGQT